MVTNPRSGSLTIDSRFSAVSVLIRSATFWARAVSATAPPHVGGTGGATTLVMPDGGRTGVGGPPRGWAARDRSRRQRVRRAASPTHGSHALGGRVGPAPS